MIQQFENLINEDLMIKTNDFFNKTFKNDNYPYISYFGINFLKNQIKSIKFYFITSKKIDIEFISKYFPFDDILIDKYKQHKECLKFDLNNLGVGFSIKINQDKKFSYAYYQDTFQHNEPMKSIVNLSIPYEEIPVRENYFVYEINKEIKYIKNYKLLLNNLNIKYTLENFGLLKLNENDFKSIEYAEFNTFSKINLNPKNQKTLDDLLEIYFEPQVDFIEYLCGKYNLHAGFPGFYKSSEVKSIYFFNNNVEENFFDNKLSVNKLYHNY